MASGHINPSLPIARQLVALGHEVHYLSREQMRSAIEDTGAKFHDEVPALPEMYEGRSADEFGAIASVMKELGLEAEPPMQSSLKIREIMLELMLPGTLRWLSDIKAQALVFCPLMSQEAAYGAKLLGIPSVGLLTTAGPGSVAKIFQEFLKMAGSSAEDLIREVEAFEPRKLCRQRLLEQHGLDIDNLDSVRQLGRLETMIFSSRTLVTTCQELQEPLPEHLEAAYREAGARFEAVGPLLDQEGATRAAGHKFAEGRMEETSAADPMAVQGEALAAGRRIVLVSMGTVLVGDSPLLGWDAQLPGSRLTGRELCQAAWGAAFDAFGGDDSVRLFVSLGPQSEPLGELQPPANAMCLPSLPQVDLLTGGAHVFLSHGGQNSFTEALSAGVPMVVCPGFGDQPANGAKAVSLGAGKMVERPLPEQGAEKEAIALYRKEVAAALREVLATPSYRDAAARCAAQLKAAGGVPRAVEVILEAAASGAKRP